MMPNSTLDYDAALSQLLKMVDMENPGLSRDEFDALIMECPCGMMMTYSAAGNHSC